MPKYYGDEPDDVVDLHDVKDQHVENDMVDLNNVETPPPPKETTPQPKSVMTDLTPMPFGKFKGRPMQDVPVDYLHWLWEKDVYGPVKIYIEQNLNALKMENKDLIWKRR